MHAHRHLELFGEERRREVAADRGAAHAGDDDVPHVAIRGSYGRLARDGPGVANLLWKVLDTAQHVAGIRLADALHALDHRCVAALCYRHRYAPLTILTPATSSGASTRSSFVYAQTRTSGSVPERRSITIRPTK